MSVPRRFNEPQGLANIDVLIEDDAPISLYFNVVEVPEVITQGKSSFLIGGSNLLKPQTEIKFEITNDDTGAVVYTEPVAGYLEGTSRRVSVEVYEDINLFGDSTLTVVGELDPSKTDVPIDFQGVYNVRYTRKIYVSAAGVNTQPILFYQQPRMVVSEIVKPYITTTTPSGSVQQTGNVTGEPSPEELGNTTNTKQIEEPGKFLKKEKNSFRTKLFGGGGNNSFVRKGRRRARRSSPEGDKFTITKKAGNEFDAKLIGGELTIKNPQVDTSKFELKDFHEVPTSYKSDIENVKNAETLIPSTPFTIIDTRFDEDSPEREVIVPLANEGFEFTASFSPLPTQSISTVNFRSYADIRLSRLRTFSGDIDRVKVYARNKDAFGDFEMVSDQQIESPELLFNVFGAGNQRIGYFHSQDHVNLYWSSGSNTLLTQDSQYILNSVAVSGSNLGKDDFLLFQQTGSLPISYLKDTEYEISANVLGFTGPKTNIDESISNQGLAAIFISGSGFENNHDFGSQLGFQLTNINNKPGFLKVTDGNIQDFGTINETFSPVRDGTGVLQFVVFGGRFHVSDVSITPATDTGFSPNFIQVIAPVPPLTQERPDDYEFLAEFYDVNNNIAETISFASASTFQGGNSYILGDDNVLSGSMFIGSSIGGGIEMAGVSSGFLRSIGYKGFTSGSAYPSQGPGFLLYSGSVLSNITDDYANGGVGLELVGHSGSYFRFRTDPAELDIRTDAFFIGQEPLQFISGSGGNIEISSSLFHLDPKNDLLTIGADAVINADLSVNNIFSPAGTNAQTAKAAITSEGFARFVSASIGAFKLNNDSLFSGPNDRPNFFISGSATGTDFFISSSNFQVRATGEVSASSLQLEGGSVGGLDVSEGTVSVGEILKLKDTGEITGSAVLLGDKSAAQYLQYIDNVLTVRGDITVDSITTPAVIAGSPSTVLNASASITADGLATFKSGSIAGWKIFGSKLSGSNATLDADGAALYKSDQGPNTDSSAAFPQLRDEYYIDFTPEGGDSSGYYIKMGPNFGVDKDGILFASGATFQGSISASSGLIGGFTIGSSSLFSSDLFISGSPLEGGVDDPRYMFISTSKFNVKQNGDITGSNAKFSGGEIAGWTINDTNLTSNGSGIRLNANGDNSEISINSHTFANEGIQLGFNGGSPRFYAGDGAQNFLRYDSSNGVSIKTTLFELDTPSLELSTTHASMSLGTGQEVVIRGNSNSPFIALQPSVALADKAFGETGIILAVASGTTPLFSAVGSGGHIKFNGTGLDISTDTFKLDTSTFDVDSAGGGSIALGTTPNTSIAGTNKGIFMSGSGDFLLFGNSSNFFKFDSTGNSIELKTDTFDLDASTLVMKSDSTGSIALGASPPSAFDSGTGFFVDGGGNLLLGSSSGNRVQYNATSGTITLKSQTFFLDASTIVIDSSVNSGKIAMGPVPPTAYNSGNGFYVDGTGKLLIGSGSGNHVQFDGSNIDIVAEAFFIGNTNTQFMSGSNSNIEISSSLFHLDPANDALIIGADATINADLTVNNLRTPAQIGGTTSTTLNASSSITSEGFARFVSASIGGFDVDDSTIASTDDSLILRSSGQITGSAVILGDKSAGQFLQFVGSTLTVQGDITANTIRTPASIGGATSTDLNASSSIDENGLATFKSASIAGWDITPTEIKKGTNVSLDSTNKRITINSSTFGAQGVQLDYNSGTPRFYVGDGSNKHLKFDGADVDIKSAKFELDASNLELSSTQASMSLGEGKIKLVGASTSTITVGAANAITLKDDGTDRYLVVGDKTSFSHFDQSTDGIIFGTDNGTAKFEIASDGDNYISFNGSGLDIKAETFDLATTKLVIDSGTNDGKIALGATPPTSLTTNKGFYADGTGKVLIGDADGNRISFDNTNLIMSASKFFLGSSAQFVSGSNGNIEISSSNFHLDAEGDVIMSGNISATTGEIGGFTIDSDEIKNAGNIALNSSTKALTINDSTFGNQGIQLEYNGGTPRMYVGDGSSEFFKFDGTNIDIRTQKANISGSEITLKAPDFFLGDLNNFISGSGGSLKIFSTGDTTLSGSSVTIATPQFFMGATGSAYVSGSEGNIEISSSKFFLKSDGTLNIGAGNLTTTTDGDVTMTGTITANAGTIGGFTIDADEIKSGTNISLNSANKALTINDATFGNQGIQLEYNSGTPRFYVGDGSNRHVKFDGTDVDIKTDTFLLDTTNLDIDSSTARIEVSDGSATRVRIGEVDSTAASHFGLVIFDGTGTTASDEIVHLSDAKNQIASWSLSPNQITSQNLVIDSAGIIQTSDFASGVQGWRITSANNGEAEFEKVTVRGTLATTVFEKETVNAVGGQLYVANSTIISSSAQLSATATTMSVANVAGFVEDEIISAKKISDTGFSTEYMLIESASRDEPASGKNFAGKLFVVRGYSGSSPQDSGSLGDSAGSATTYENGQVIVSTGKIGTGFIRLNANPNDQTTPYIDIVERTGSAIYDVSLKARLGDLSGLSSGLLYGETNPGFGLFTENVFLSGAITAQTGSIEGILHVRTDLNNQIKIGTNVENSLDGIYINDNNFWYTNGHFKTGFDGDNFIHQSGSKLEIKSEDIDFQGSNFLLEADGSSGKFYLGTITSDSDTSGQGVFMDSGGHFRVIGNATNQLIVDGGSLTMKSDTFDLLTSTLHISSSQGGAIAMGSTIPTQLDDNGIFLSGSGEFNFQSDSNNLIRLDGSTLTLKSQTFSLTGTNLELSNDKFKMGTLDNATDVADSSTGFLVDSSGNVLIKQGGANAEYLQFNGGGIDIKAGTFDLATSTMVLDSGTNNGTISLGSTPNTSVAGTNTGFYVDGGGDVLLRADADNFIKMNIGSSPVLDMKAETFFMGGTAQFLSGSNGKLEISSSNFHLQPDGDTIMQGKITATSGEIAGLNIDSNKIYVGTGTHNNSNTAFYVEDDGKFSLKDKLSWDGSNLSIEGSITITGGSGFASPDAVSGSFASGDAVSGSVSQLSGSVATDVGGLVQGSSSMAATARLTNTGMEILNSDDNVIAVYSADATIGRTAAGQSNVLIDSDGSVDIRRGTEVSASFGTTTTIGPTSGQHVSIDSDSLDIKTASTTHATFAATSVIGSSTDKVTISDSGITIRENNVDAISLASGAITIRAANNDFLELDGTSIDIFRNNVSVVNLTDTAFTLGGTSNEHIIVDTDGLTIKDGGTVRGQFTAVGATIGNTSNAHVSASTFDVSIIQDANHKAVVNASGLTVTEGGNQVAQFAATTTIGSSTDKVTISDSGITIRENNSDTITLSSGTTTIGSSTDKVTISSSGITIRENNTDNMSFSSGDITLTGGTITIRSSDNNNDKVIITQDSFKVFDNNTDVASFGAITRIGDKSNEHISMSSAGMTVKDGTTQRAVFAATSVIGSSTDKVTISDSGITIRENNSDQITMADNVITVGSSTDKVTINGTSGITIKENNKDNISLVDGTIKIGVDENDSTFVQIDSDSVDIIEDVSGTNTTVASFGLATTIGGTSGEHVKIDSSAVSIKTDANTTVLSASSAGLEMAGTVKASGGTIGGLNIGSDKLFVGTGNHNNTDTAFYVEDDGKFSLKDKLSWDGSNLSIEGSITITGGSGFASPDAVSGSFGTQGAISGSVSELSGSVATDVGGLTAGSQSMATQVVLASDGMSLKNASGTTLASYGTTVSLRGNGSTDDRLDIDADGVEIFEGGQLRSIFGQTTVLGSGGAAVTTTSTDDCIRIADGTVSIFQDDSNKAIINSSGLTITQGGNEVGAFGANPVITGGTVTIRSHDNNDDKIIIAQDSFKIFDNGTKVGHFGAITAIGDTDNEHISMSSNGLTLKDGGTTIGSFKATGATIGNTSNAHVSASTLDVSIIQDANHKAVIDASGMTVTEGGSQVAQFAATTVIGSSTDKVTISDSGGIVIRENNADSITLNGGAVEIRAANNDYLEIDGTSVDIFRNNVSVVNLTDTAFTLGGTSNEHIIVDTDGLTIKDGGTVRGQFKATGATIGNTSDAHISASTLDVSVIKDSNNKAVVSSDGLAVTQNSGVRAIFGATSVIGSSGAAVTTTSTDDCIRISDGEVNIFQDSSNLAKLSSTGLEVTQSGAGVANFAGTTTIGNTSTEHIEITSTSLKLKDGGTTRIEMDSNGVDIGSNFAVDSSGNVTMTGQITAETGQIGDWSVLHNGQLLSAGTTGDAVHSASFEAGGSAQFLLRATNETHTALVPQPNPRQEILQRLDQGIKSIASTTFYPDATGVGANLNRFTGEELSLGALPSVFGTTIDGHTPVIGDNAGWRKLWRYRDAFDDDVHESWQMLIASGSETNSITGERDPFRGCTLSLITNQFIHQGVNYAGTGTIREVIRIGGMKGSFREDVKVPNNVKRFGVMAPTGSFGYLHLSSSTAQGGTGESTFHVNSDGIQVTVDDDYDFLFKDGGEFHADADILAFSTTTSDISLKDNIQTISGSLNKVMNLRGVEYVWNKGGRKGQKDLGVVAQEVEKVLPEIVRDKRLPLMDSSDKTYKTVDYERITAVLIEGMKEQQEQIDELRREVEELKNGSSK